MSSNVRITDRKELKEFVRTHLGHRLTAMAAPICFPESAPIWTGRNDVYRAAKEGSYSMVRTFIEFLGVRSKKNSTPAKLTSAHGESDSILIDAFACFGTQKVHPNQFGTDEDFMAETHRTLCKISSHFTYDQTQTALYDRVASPDDCATWTRAVNVIVKMLDEHFYSVVREPITVHIHLAEPFRARFVRSLDVKSAVVGDDLGRP
jgi:hypothetical protein